MSAMRQEESSHRLWSAADDAVLRAEYGRVPARELAQRLGRTARGVWDRAQTLHLTQPGQRRPWTPDEDGQVRALYGRIRQADLAERLGRTVPSLVGRATILRVTQPVGPLGQHVRDQQEIAQLRAEIDHLKHGALDAAHAPAADARRLAVLIAYRLNIIDAAEAAVVLGVPPARLLVEVAKAAKLGQDITHAALEGT